jgi:hypothetical protein
VAVEPHHKDSITRAAGLEACLVDFEPVVIRGLDGDDRSATLRVAGRAALLVAKAHKIYERAHGTRTDPKDAYDVYRLLLTCDLDVVRGRLDDLERDERCGAVVQQARTWLSELYADTDSLGPRQTSELEDNPATAAETRARAAALVDAVI